jgi:hypothetical protein
VNAMWQRQLASLLEHEARVLRADGRCAAAMPIIAEGLALSTVLQATAAEMDVAQRTHLALVNERAACLLDSGRAREARSLLDELLAQAAAPDPKRVDFVARASALAMSRYLAGRSCLAGGQPDPARKHWELGLALLEPSRSDPNYRAVRVLLLYALGRSRDAQEMHAQLSALGYAEPAFARQAKAAGP